MVEENDQTPSSVEYLLGESTLGGGDDGADGSTEAAEAESGKETLDSAVNLNQKDGSLVLRVDSNEVSTGDVGDLGLEVGDGGGNGNDVADGALNGGEVKSAEETEKGRLNLEEKVFATSEAVHVSDGEDVLERVGALDVAGDGLKAANDGAEKAADLAKTEAVEEIDDCLGQLNEHGVAILEDGSDLGEAGAAAGVELVDGPSGLNDLANGLLEGAEGQLAHQTLELGLGHHLKVRGSGLVEDGKNLTGAGALGQAGGGTGRNGQGGQRGGCGSTGASGDHRCHGERDTRGDDARGQARGNSGGQRAGGA